jgi:hypothetical protein
LRGIGDRDDLHDAGVGEFADALSDSGFAEAYGLSNFGVRLPAIALEQADDFLRGIIQSHSPGRR